jgi:hypothetical protein
MVTNKTFLVLWLLLRGAELAYSIGDRGFSVYFTHYLNTPFVLLQNKEQSSQKKRTSKNLSFFIT